MISSSLSAERLDSILKELIELSKEVGVWMKSQTGMKEDDAEIKSANNLVTYVDKESERQFVNGLMRIFPEAGFVAEEGTGEQKVNGFNWVIDPLDGTTNFVHGVPVWCTSVALCEGDHPVVGVIYDPNLEECFSARIGGGAAMNGKAIAVTEIAALEKSLLATGFPYDDFGREDKYIALFRELMRKTRGMRRLGSAALDLAWTACGRFEGFYEYGLNPWDMAAGVIIVREAGGIVTTFHGHDAVVFAEDMIATNGGIHPEISTVIRSHF